MFPKSVRSTGPLSSIADIGRLPDALENEAGADRGAAWRFVGLFSGNTNAGRGVGRLLPRESSILLVPLEGKSVWGTERGDTLPESRSGEGEPLEGNASFV